MFGGPFAVDPYHVARPANTAPPCKESGRCEETIPPGFERQVAAQGWPKPKESIFSRTDPGLSEAEFQDLIKVLHARGDELLESVKHSLLAQNQSTTLSAKVSSERSYPSSPTEWRECVGRGPPISFALDGPEYDEARRLHEMTSDLDSRVRSLILASAQRHPAQVALDTSKADSFNGPNHVYQPPVQTAAARYPQLNSQHPQHQNKGQTSQSLPVEDFTQDLGDGKRRRRRQNQAQRRQISAQSEAFHVPSLPENQGYNTYLQPTRVPQLVAPPVGPRGSHPQSQPLHNGPSGQPYQQVAQTQFAPGYGSYPSTQMQYPHDSHVRPPPRHQRLYEPGLSSDPQQQHRANINAQVQWLNTVAQGEIAKAEITFADLQEKENLRLVLEVVCREVINDLEQPKNNSFDPGSVALKSFGSLSSGFATHSSDMDLVLVSPYSIPEPASADSDIPRLLEKRFLELGHGAQLLTKTRIPIIKFCEKPTPDLLKILQNERSKWEEQKTHPAQAEKAPSNNNRPNNTVSSSSVDTKAPRSGVNPNGSNHSVKSDEGPRGKEENPLKTLVQLYELAISDGWYSDAERLLIREFVQQVKQHNADHNNAEIIEAQHKLDGLPDVLKRYRNRPAFSPARLEFPKTGVGIHCDINFSNHIALQNTLLLRCYCHCDPRVRQMVIFIKAWAKRRRINSAYHGTLSSYGYVLMVLHYLVNVATPPVAPNLQLAWKAPTQGSWAASLEETTMVDGHDVRFWRSEVEIQKLAASGLLSHNKESIGSLLRGFFEYFAHQGPQIVRGGFAWTHDVLSLRTRGGILTKQSKGWVAAKTDTMEPSVPGQDVKEVRQRYLFAIEDPFEHEHNVARTVVHHGVVAIRDEFRRAFAMMQRVGRAYYVGDLFEEAPERNDLQRRRDSPKKKVAGAEATDNSQKDTGSTIAVGALERKQVS
ncbi:hypothetical protein MMC16_004501 [Acarospora aff. strigata]|nr:hypothetical protein [Acarospora aff. strigata]